MCAEKKFGKKFLDHMHESLTLPALKITLTVQWENRTLTYENIMELHN